MYIAQAYKVLHEPWRYIVGLLTILVAWQFIGALPLMAVVIAKSIGSGETPTGIPEMAALLGNNLFLFLMLTMFVFGLLAVFFCAKIFHKQSITSLTTARAKIDWKRIFTGFFVVLFFNLILFGIGYWLSPDGMVWNFKLKPFLILVAISVLLLPLQTSFEEYLFRGYLMQGIGVAVKNRWFPLIITSIFFGLLHIANPEVEKLGYITMVYYIGTGLVLGIMTLMDDGMELALGYHAGNNILTALLVTTDWSALQTDALFIDTSDPKAGFFDIVVPVLVVFPIMLFVFSKIYKWTNWKEKLFGAVEKPVIAHQVPEDDTIGTMIKN